MQKHQQDKMKTLIKTLVDIICQDPLQKSLGQMERANPTPNKRYTCRAAKGLLRNYFGKRRIAYSVKKVKQYANKYVVTYDSSEQFKMKIISKRIALEEEHEKMMQGNRP